jgi:phenol hydroxylase P3 protein
VQAKLATHQILQGNCGGSTEADVLAWYGIQPGDNGEYRDSVDARSWAQWHQ